MNIFKSQHQKDTELAEKILEEERDALLYEKERRERVKEMMAEHQAEADAEELAAKQKEAEYVEVRKGLYSMQHHTRLQIRDDTWVERVPGGWIYTYETDDKTKADATTFVPFEAGQDETYNKLKQTNE